MRWKGNKVMVRVLFSQAGVATQTLVQAGDLKILVDVGDGTLRDLLAMGVSPLELTGALLTHGHTDHTGGLFALLGYLRAEGRDNPFSVWYPTGCCEVPALIGAFRSCNGGTTPFQISERGLRDGETVRAGSLEITGRCVEHWHSIRGRPLSPAPAMGYRLACAGEVVVISGDSAPCRALTELIRGADLALIEATLADDASDEERTCLHLSESAAGELGKLAGHTLFIHRPYPRGHGWQTPSLGEKEVVDREQSQGSVAPVRRECQR